MSSPFKSLTNLPSRLRSKISCDGADDTECWIWTGKVSPERKRLRLYAHETARLVIGCHANERERPVVWSSEHRYAVPARRYVYAIAADLPYELVPRLGTCTHPRCVSPHHARNLGPVPARGDSLAGIDLLALDRAEKPAGSPLEALKASGVSSMLDPASAALEAGLDASSVTPEIWVEFCAWDDAENPG